MLTLQLDGHKLGINTEGCQDIIEKLPLGKTNALFYPLGPGFKLPKRKYARPFFKFAYQGRTWQVSAKRYDELMRACQDGITGDSYFMIGMHAVSVTNVRCFEVNEYGEKVYQD